MPPSVPSKSEIDRLGDRLREVISEEDLRLLDAYRLSFANAYIGVIDKIRNTTGVDASGRPAKSTTAIVDKLRRESIRLSQMQDIAGCRIVVDSYTRQNALTEALSTLFLGCVVSDRRKNPSHGYRAVHLIVPYENRFVEVQIRTELQHLWAELSEKLSDKFGIDVKYGKGPKHVREFLGSLSGYKFFELAENLAPPSPSEPTRKRIQEGKTLYRTALTTLLAELKENDDFLD